MNSRLLRCCLLLLLAPAVYAGNIVVNTTADSGPGSLRQALADAASGAFPGPDTITFDPALNGKTIAVMSSFSDIAGTDGVTVDASALSAGVKLDGGSQDFRFFNVNPGASLTLHGLTLSRGGGASTEVGGAISNDGTLTLTRCTLSGNLAGQIPSGGGAINNNGTATLTHCTLSGNSANSGGAIFNIGPLALTHCTVSGNTATGGFGGGVVVTGGTNLTLTNTIVAGNSASNNPAAADIFNTGTITLVGANLVPAFFGIAATGSGTIDPTAPNLATLGNYGGPTQTRPPLPPTNPAIDTATAVAGLTTDQRGVARGAAIWTNDFSTGLGGATVLAGALDGGSFRLTPEVGDQAGTLVLPEVGSLAGFALSFDYQFATSGNPPADGMSVSIGPRPAAFVNDGGVPGTPRVLFDIFNGGGSSAGAIRYIRPDGATGATNTTALNRDAFPAGDRNVFRAVRIDFTAGGELTVRYKGAVVLGPIATGYAVQAGDTITFGARTGGSSADQRIDNIGLITQPVGVADIGAVEALSGPVNAVVTSRFDSGPGTLRDLLAAVPTGSTITFDPAVFTGPLMVNTISLVTSAGGSAFDIPAGKAVTIDVTAMISGGVTLQGGSLGFRFFRVNTGASLTLHGLTLTGGGGTSVSIDGGAIDNGGTLTLTRCTFSSNRVTGGLNISKGGAIHNGGTATLMQCTFSGNSASGTGGAISNGSTGTLTLTHCTLSGNTSTLGNGGGICNQVGTTTLTHCTLSGNTAPAGNGSGVASFGNANTVTKVQNCIISGNTNSSVDIFGGGMNSFSSLGHNLIGTGNGLALSAFNATGDILNNTPGLSGLGDNGGPTQTMGLLPNSPARGAAAVLDPAITADQRGFPIAGLPDIGAFEFPNTPPAAPSFSIDATTGDQQTIGVGASDEDGIPPTITSVDPSGGITVNSFNGLNLTFTPPEDLVGLFSIEYTVSDGDGGSNSGIITLDIADNDAPSIGGTFSPLMVVAGTMPDYRGQAVKSDNVGEPTVTQSPLQGSATTAGTVPVTLTATDTAGNTAETSFDLIVRPAAPVSTVFLAKGADAPGRLTSADLPDDAVIASFGVPAIDDAGSVAFLAKWTAPTGPLKRGTGLFVNDKCLAIVGGAVPGIGGATFRTFADPVIHGGNVACLATISGAGKVVLFGPAAGPLAVLAQSGTAAPDAGGATFKKFGSVGVAGSNVGFSATLTGPATGDIGLWLKAGAGPLALVLREGSDPLSNTLKTIVAFKPGNGSPGAGRGWVRQSAQSWMLALVTHTDRTVLPVVLQSGPGGVGKLNNATTATGETFASFGLPAANAIDDVAFLAKLAVGGAVTKANASGIFANAMGGNFNTIARVGAPAPATGANFTLLKDPILDNTGALAFPATISARGPAKTTLWWKPPGDPLALLAQGGAPAAEVPGANWKAFTSLAIAADRGPIFTATLSTRASGAWASDFTGTTRKLFATGDPIGAKTLKSIKLLNATVGSMGVTRSFNDNAQVVWLATFTDKTTAVMRTDVP